MVNSMVNRFRSGNKYLSCPVCGGILCRQIYDNGCDGCDLINTWGCDRDKCRCASKDLLSYIETMQPNIVELGELRHKLIMIEKAVNSGPVSYAMKAKLNHILKGGWKNGGGKLL